MKKRTGENWKKTDKTGGKAGILPLLRRGSFTVEASLVFPIVLMGILGGLYLCFFFHNRAFLQAAACEAALCGCLEESSGAGTAGAAAELRTRERGNMGFFGGNGLRFSVADGSEVKVGYEMEIGTDFTWMRWPVHVEGEAKLLYPAINIWRERK